VTTSNAIKNLKAIRERRKMTQAELAEKVGVSRLYVSRLEAGKHDPPLSRVRAIAKALGVSVGRLVD
jgi:transcriptional regulator with XRE-family HTH domain